MFPFKGYVIALLLLIFIPGTCVSIISCILWLLIASSLWAESTLAYHREVLPTIVHLYLALWPGGGQWRQDYLAGLLQMHIASIYWAASNQKIFCSIFQKNPSGFWGFYSLVGFVWEASWSHPEYQILQRALLRHPLLAGLAGTGSLLMQWSLLPFLLLGGSTQIVAGIYLPLLIFFHVAILLLMGVDYMFWIPSLAVFGACQPVGGWQGVHMLWSDTIELTPIDQICVVLLLGLFLSQIIFATFCFESFNINLPPLMSSPMYVTVNTIFGPQWHNQTLFIENHAGTIEYPQLEWNYPPIKKEFGIGLDISSIKYFSSSHVLAKDFLIAGSYDPSSPMYIPLCSSKSYFLSSSELETLLSSCPYSLTRKIKGTSKLFYLVTNRKELLGDNIVGEFLSLAKHLHSHGTHTQLVDKVAVERCLQLQDNCTQLCKEAVAIL